MAKIYEENPWLKTLEGELDIDLDTLYELEPYFSDSDPLVVEESKLNTGDITKKYECIVIVDNVPVVPVSKLGKVKAMLSKVFGSSGTILEGFLSAEDTGIDVPLSEDESKTVGFALVHYTTAREALQAVKDRNNFKLDEKHTFKVNLYSDFVNISDYNENYQAPEAKDQDFEQVADRYSWLDDEFYRSQFSIRHGQDTEVWWSDGIALDGQTTLAYGGEREKASGKVWTENGTMWSPQGTYFVTFHSPGICFWTGKNFERSHRFGHSGVIDLIFSPDESKIITWNGSTDKEDASALILWDVETSKKIRAFRYASSESELADSFAFPFQFSPDSSYFARAIKNGISLYSSKTAKIIGKPFKAKGIVTFKWSPSDNLIALWAPEDEPLPAAVAVVDPIKRETLKRKNLFNVKDVTLHWHNKGDFLCAEVMRSKKKSKNTFASLEIFRMRGTNIPVETLEMKENSIHFSFEPCGVRFCVILHDHVTNLVSQCFYTAKQLVGGNVELLVRMEETFRNISWSPIGNIVILNNFAKGEASISFFDLDEQKVIAEGDHYTARDICWDPSGRMVATVAHQNLFGENMARDRLENGWYLWSFQGQLLQKNSVDKLYQLKWRPVPAKIDGVDLWTSEHEEELQKNLKSYLKKYVSQGELKKKKMEIAANSEKLKMLKQYRSLMASKVETDNKNTEERIRLNYILQLSPSDYEAEDMMAEELLSEKVEIVSK